MTHEELMMGIQIAGGEKLLEPVEGLLLEPDTSPFTSICMGHDHTTLFDGDLDSLVSGAWTSLFSYGLDLGSAKEVTKLVVHLNESHGTAGGWTVVYDGNQMDIYKSSDRCNWTLVQLNDRPPLTGVDGAYCKAELPLPAPTTARYWKVVNSDLWEHTSIAGWSYRITEIQAISP